MTRPNSPAYRYPLAAINLMQKARTRHDRAEMILRDAQTEFCAAWHDWQETTGADRAVFRPYVLVALESLRLAREDVVLTMFAMDGAGRMVEGVTV